MMRGKGFSIILFMRISECIVNGLRRVTILALKRVWGRGSFMFVYAAFIFIAFSSSKVWYAKAGVSGNELTGACAP